MPSLDSVYRRAWLRKAVAEAERRASSGVGHGGRPLDPERAEPLRRAAITGRQVLDEGEGR